MKSIILPIAVCFVLVGSSLSLGVEPLPDGFGGLTFGSSASSELISISKSDVSNNGNNYTVETDWNDSLFGVNVDRVRFVFVNDKLYSAVINTVKISTKEYATVVAKVSERFGPPVLSGCVVQEETIHLWEQGNKSIRIHAPVVSNGMTLRIDISQFLPEMRCSCLR